MCRALLAVIALCWASVVEATEVYICEASFEHEYEGRTRFVQYEFRLAVDDDNLSYLTALPSDAKSDPKLIAKPHIFPLSGSLRIVTTVGNRTTSEDEAEITGFATRLPSPGWPLIAVIFQEFPPEFPMIIIGYPGDDLISNLGIDPFNVFDTTEARKAIGKCQ